MPSRDEDRLLRELACLAEDQSAGEYSRFDKRWDRLSDGTLSTPEEQELRSEVAKSPHLGFAYDAFRPLDKEFRTQLASKLKAQVKVNTAAVDVNKPSPLPVSPSGPLSLPRRNLSRRSWVAVAASLLVALGLSQLLWFEKPLPSYQLDGEGGLEIDRSGSGSSADFLYLTPGVQFTLLLTPLQEVQDSIGIRVFANRDENWQIWQSAAEIAEFSDQGSVRILATYGEDLNLSAGDWTLWLAVGRRRDLPTLSTVQTALSKSELPTEDWQLKAKKVRILAAPP